MSVKNPAFVYKYKPMVYFIFAGGKIAVALNIENNKHTLTTKNIKTMKTTILTIAIAVATVFGISQSTYAATTGSSETSTMLTDVSSINSIEVHGNVELYLSDGNTDQVKVYNNYYAENAMVQDQNGVLRITSYTTEKLVVWVTASELSKLSVYDNAEVKSFGKLSAIDLEVELSDNATATLDVDAYAAKITLNDRAKANLTGSVTEGKLQYTRSSSLNTTDFAVAHVVKQVKFHKMNCARPTEFASL